MLIGEAPGENEENVGVPFIGAAGVLLDETLRASGFNRGAWYPDGRNNGLEYFSELYVTNVFSERPPDNDLKGAWTVTKTELRKRGIPEGGRLPPLNKRYVLPEFEAELARLDEEIREIKPDLIIALGGTALWALTGDGRITLHRGTFFPTKWDCLAIASFHPAMVLRQYEQRPLLWADLSKAKRHLNGTLPAPTRRRFWIDPTWEEMESVYESFARSGQLLGVDIETDPRISQITSVSFGTDTEAICFPFYDKHTLPEKCNYWQTAQEEARAWRWVIRFGALANEKALQNGLYDFQYLLLPPQVWLAHVTEDTAIMSHAAQPELKKDLGTLASVYLNEPSWKFMRESAKDVNKADD